MKIGRLLQERVVAVAVAVVMLVWTSTASIIFLNILAGAFSYKAFVARTDS